MKNIEPSNLVRSSTKSLTFLASHCFIIIMIFNLPLLSFLSVAGEKTHSSDIFLTLSIIAILTSLMMVMMIPFVALNIHKISVTLITFFAGVFSYFSFKYGILYDETLIESTLKTNYNESSEYFTYNFLIYSIVLASILGFIYYYIQIEQESFKKRLRLLGKIIGLFALTVFFCTTFFYKEFASILRNNRQIRHMIVPIAPIYELSKAVSKRNRSNKSNFQVLGEDATKLLTPRKKLFVLVLGETARSDHFSVNGYSKNLTNPLMSKKDIVSIRNVTACGTSTAISVPCIFSGLSRSDFDPEKAKNQSNLLDILDTAGIKVSWIDNNSGCQGVCVRTGETDITELQNSDLCSNNKCHDEILVNALKKYSNVSQDQFVVLHMLGSHGPHYNLRYPDRFSVFEPSCKTNDLGSCTREQIVNSYDNTILYTDFVLSKVIELLDNLSQRLDTAMIYVSDHGESLGENGVYLHSLPYFVAPIAQKEVPLVFWFSKGFLNRNEVSNFKSDKKRKCNFSHDNLFSTILRLMQVRTSAYSKDLDIFNRIQDSCSE